VGNGVSLAQLMNFAYGSPWRYGPGILAWARDESESNQQLFQIDAAASDPSSTTAAQLRQMLQSMLADRFKLQMHREPQEIKAYAMRVAKSGSKLKEASGDLEPPRFGAGITGKSSLDALAQFLTEFLIEFDHLGSIDVPFVNSTGLTGNYDYAFRLRPGGGGLRGGGDPNAGPPSKSERLADTVAAISASMEDQLGLRLQEEKAHVDVIVLDHVEKPSEN
jgi:uncharacterized protein (TIGR03435 family)